MNNITHEWLSKELLNISKNHWSENLQIAKEELNIFACIIIGNQTNHFEVNYKAQPSSKCNSQSAHLTQWLIFVLVKEFYSLCIFARSKDRVVLGSTWSISDTMWYISRTMFMFTNNKTGNNNENIDIIIMKPQLRPVVERVDFLDHRAQLWIQTDH